MEDCDASIVPRLHLSSFMVQGCGKPQRQGGEGFPAKPGERSRLRGFAAAAGKEVVRARGDSEPGWSAGRGSQAPPSDPAVETSPRLPHHPGACPCRSPPRGASPPWPGVSGAGLLPPEPPVQTVRGEGRCCARHAPGALHQSKAEPKLARCRWQGTNPNPNASIVIPGGQRGSRLSPDSVLRRRGGGLGGEGAALLPPRPS